MHFVSGTSCLSAVLERTHIFKVSAVAGSTYRAVCVVWNIRDPNLKIPNFYQNTLLFLMLLKKAKVNS